MHNRLYLLCVISLFAVVVVSLSLLKMHQACTPDRPYEYLTTERARDLARLADKFIKESDLSQLSAVYDRYLQRWEIKIDGRITSRYQEQIIPLLERENLQSMRIEKGKMVATFGYYASRRWHEYSYLPAGGYFTPQNPYKYTIQITNNWYFGVW